MVFLQPVPSLASPEAPPASVQTAQYVFASDDPELLVLLHLYTKAGCGINKKLVTSGKLHSNSNVTVFKRICKSIKNLWSHTSLEF